MGKFYKLGNSFEMLLRYPKHAIWGLSNHYDELYKYKSYVKERYGIEEGLPNLDIMHLFPVFEETVFPYAYLSQGSSPMDIALLKCLARRYEACSFLEIGTWRGESITNVAQIASNCTSLSLSDNDLRNKGLNEDFIEQNRFFSEDYPNITHIQENSQKFNFNNLNKLFDLIYIDADHSYEGIKSDTRNAFEVLKDDTSVIVWHDYSTTEKVKWTTLAAILDGMPRHTHGNLYHVSNTMCAIYIKGNFNKVFKKFPQTPNKVFEITIKGKKLDN